jgi:hypothetical protein
VRVAGRIRQHLFRTGDAFPTVRGGSWGVGELVFPERDRSGGRFSRWRQARRLSYGARWKLGTRGTHLSGTRPFRREILEMETGVTPVLR